MLDPSPKHSLDQLFTEPGENAAAFCISWIMNRARVHRQEGKACVRQFIVGSERASLEVYAEALEDLKYLTSTQEIALNQCRDFLSCVPLPEPAVVAYLRPRRVGRLNQVLVQMSQYPVYF